MTTAHATSGYPKPEPIPKQRKRTAGTPVTIKPLPERFVGTGPIPPQPKRGKHTLVTRLHAEPDEVGTLPLDAFLDAVDAILTDVMTPLVGLSGDEALAALPADTIIPIIAAPVTIMGGANPTREAWMLAAVEALRPDFMAAGADVPAVRVSVGWPGGRGSKAHVVGQCWAASAVSDHQPAIFVSPVQQEPLDVLETLVHELVHACGNPGHRGGFIKLAGKVGLTAPWKSTPASEPLKARLLLLADALGPFDHGKISRGVNTTGLVGPTVQTTRMLKCVCSVCGYTVRTTRKWLDEAGAPYCPAHKFGGHVAIQMDEVER